jgi:hypothetical protein
MSTPPTPQQRLHNHLGNSAYRGTFESHITTEVACTEEQQRFQVVCQQLGARCVVIELPNGVTHLQPMTVRYHHGAIGAVLDEVGALCRGVTAAGFAVARVKLEAIATAEGVPDTDEDAARLPAANYFEFHVKLLLSATADLAALRACCDRHTARLSRNALKMERDGRSERFVTLRHYGMGRRNACIRLEALERDLTTAGFTVINRQREYTIFDSAEHLDAGWIDPPRMAGAGP